MQDKFHSQSESFGLWLVCVTQKSNARVLRRRVPYVEDSVALLCIELKVWGVREEFHNVITHHTNNAPFLTLKPRKTPRYKIAARLRGFSHQWGTGYSWCHWLSVGWGLGFFSWVNKLHPEPWLHQSAFPPASEELMSTTEEWEARVNKATSCDWFLSMSKRLHKDE